MPRSPSKSFTPKENKAPEQPEAEPSEAPFVSRWTSKVEKAKTYFEDDFKRMHDNMNFVYGLQWKGQDKLHINRYVANLCLHQVEQKVAQLYARDPKVKARRKRRLDFKMWDGKMEGLMQAQATLAGQVPDASPEHMAGAMMLMTDYAEGHKRRALMDRVGKTLEILVEWMWDNQQPSFKEQMKDLIRCVCTCGVGYIALDFVRANEGTLAPTDVESTIAERMGRIKVIVDRFANGELKEDDADLETLKHLVEGISASVAAGEVQNINERIIYIFPQPSSIIVDPDCSCLTGFVGAHWIAQEFIMSLDEVNAFFGSSIKPNSELPTYTKQGEAEIETGLSKVENLPEPKRVCVWKIWDLDSKSQFVICKGWKRYVKEPEPFNPDVNAMWPIQALCFNKTKVDPASKDCKASIYPPSDVDILRSTQREWNRSRDSLRSQRTANEPMYFMRQNAISAEDIERLRNHTPNSVIQVNAPPEVPLDKLIVARIPAPIDPSAYDTTPLSQDLYYIFGSQPNPTNRGSNKATATAATIAEQARVTLAASNVDDLDTFLSTIAKISGEMCLKEMSKETASRIAGEGAVWTDDFENKQDFVNLVFLDIIAGSSGRPNKALDLANWQVVAPILQSVGASPMFIASETLKRLDDVLELDDVFPMGSQAPMNVLPGPTQQPSLSPSGNATPTRQNQFPAATTPHAASLAGGES